MKRIIAKISMALTLTLAIVLSACLIEVVTGISWVGIVACAGLYASALHQVDSDWDEMFPPRGGDHAG